MEKPSGRRSRSWGQPAAQGPPLPGTGSPSQGCGGELGGHPGPRESHAPVCTAEPAYDRLALGLASGVQRRRMRSAASYGTSPAGHRPPSAVPEGTGSERRPVARDPHVSAPCLCNRGSLPSTRQVHRRPSAVFWPRRAAGLAGHSSGKPLAKSSAPVIHHVMISPGLRPSPVNKSQNLTLRLRGQRRT